MNYENAFESDLNVTASISKVYRKKQKIVIFTRSALFDVCL